MNILVVAWGTMIIAGGTMVGFPVWGPVTGGLVLGLLAPRRPAAHAAVAGAMAWGLLLALSSLNGSLGLTAVRLGGALGLPPWGPLLATLLFPAILAASTAWLAGEARQRRRLAVSSASQRAA